MKFKKKRIWISPERLGKIEKLLTSPVDEDFELGKQILEKFPIKLGNLRLDMLGTISGYHFCYSPDLRRYKYIINKNIFQ